MSATLTRWGLALAVTAVLVAGCASTATPSRSSVRGPARRIAAPLVPAAPEIPSLNVAERESRNLGAVAATQRIQVTFTLRQRASGQLNAYLAKGGRLTPAQWAASYGPAPSAVAATRKVLARAGIASTWQRGDVSLAVAAPAAALVRFFHVAIDRFVMPDGTRFYAPLSVPTAPRSIAKEVVAVTGMNNYPDNLTEAIASAGGVTPAQITEFYDMTPLRNAGLNGTGETVMFPEWAVPSMPALNAYAQQFGLPPFNVQVVTNDAQWGEPATPSDCSCYDNYAGETSLDLEVVHGLAPGAKEIVYALGNAPQLSNMLQTMFNAHPGAILSSSINYLSCEQDQGAKQVAIATDAVFAQAASEGHSIFWAAGDRGAYSCLPDNETQTAGDISVMPQDESPHITSVGGTTIFMAANGAYYRESAWGDPIQQWGGGGGFGTFFSRPAWQDAPGVSGNDRGLPDVSANASSDSPWDTFVPSSGGVSGASSWGTSAATPCWAAITALIDEDLTQQHLKTVGFADPALYYFARDPSGLPATPFHQITEGNNLHYLATAGWNPATGLGSPDVAHLADDFEWFDKVHGGSV
jgi:subtilase family serine protease